MTKTRDQIITDLGCLVSAEDARRVFDYIKANSHPVAPEPGHRIEFEYEIDTVTSHAVCDEPEGADCRLRCAEGCESWRIERDADGPYHLIGTLGDDVRHEMEPCPCNVADFLNEGGVDDTSACGPGVRYGIGSLPIAAQWEGDYYSWVAAPGSEQKPEPEHVTLVREDADRTVGWHWRCTCGVANRGYTIRRWAAEAADFHVAAQS